MFISNVPRQNRARVLSSIVHAPGSNFHGEKRRDIIIPPASFSEKQEVYGDPSLSGMVPPQYAAAVKFFSDPARKITKQELAAFNRTMRTVMIEKENFGLATFNYKPVKKEELFALLESSRVAGWRNRVMPETWGRKVEFLRTPVRGQILKKKGLPFIVGSSPRLSLQTLEALSKPRQPTAINEWKIDGVRMDNPPRKAFGRSSGDVDVPNIPAVNPSRYKKFLRQERIAKKAGGPSVRRPGGLNLPRAQGLVSSRVKKERKVKQEVS